MSWSKRAFGCLAVLLWATLGARSGPQGSQSAGSAFSCPPSVTVSETATAAEGWSVRTAQVKQSFERISVFNKDSEHEYDLAPDGQKQEGSKVSQTWNLSSYRTVPLFLACRYQERMLCSSGRSPNPWQPAR
jgi:hypothetical protein